jgi:hypothetical protein
VRVDLRRHVQLGITRVQALDAALSVPHAGDAYRAEYRHQLALRDTWVRARPTVSADHRPGRLADAACVEVPVGEAPQQLGTVGPEHPLDISVGHARGFVAAQSGDQTLEVLLGTNEGIGVSDGVCLHGVGPSEDVYGSRNRIRTSPCPLFSTLLTRNAARSHDQAVVLTDPHPNENRALQIDPARSSCRSPGLSAR